MTAQDLHQFLRSRRSVRHFSDRPVPQEILWRLLETSTWAPSAHNRQPWRYAVLVNLETRCYLAETMGAIFEGDLRADGLPEAKIVQQVNRGKQRLIEAAVAIVLCMDETVMDIYGDAARQQAERLMAVQSVALAGGTLLLAAHAEGLGGVWICSPLFVPDAVRHTLGLPENWEPLGMLLLGYPQQLPEPRPRRPVEEIARFL